MADFDPYADVKQAATELTNARMKANTPATESTDLKLVPIVQATTPNDEASKKQNVGGVEVKGSPDTAPTETSDGFTDGALVDPALTAAKKSK